jgi:hypothetical protein
MTLVVDTHDEARELGHDSRAIAAIHKHSSGGKLQSASGAAPASSSRWIYVYGDSLMATRSSSGVVKSERSAPCNSSGG